MRRPIVAAAIALRPFKKNRVIYLFLETEIKKLNKFENISGETFNFFCECGINFISYIKHYNYGNVLILRKP